ncbi:acyltransferase [Paenibacillus antarcticus]|uniref:Acyltransferase n=1 Tax=Paenibacillus antarcticus TaxID=253703 RepID=A0A168Q8Z0_9BACL|nr:acyltransferase [Paenibacillus antarcticus]
MTTEGDVSTHKQTSHQRRYIPGLDGLRALSVLAVIAYHLNLTWAPGGLLGVGVFFVLSGYLITDQIVTEWQRNGRLNLKDFWIRRARRLLPAMFVMLALVAVWLFIFDRSRLISLQGDFVSSALYFNNWWLIFHNVSYFESFGPPSPIGHLWSLAIEEQFYLIWPLVLIVGLRIAPQRGKLILFILAGTMLSILAMTLLFEPGMDPSRVYYGTDTRVFALLIGAALAIASPSHKNTKAISRRARNVLDLTGTIGLLSIILMIWRTNDQGDFLYYGGLILLSVLSAMVIAVLAHPATRLTKIMGIRPLRWVGIRSYSLYIWHYPVIILTNPVLNTAEPNGLHIILQIGASLVLAALSFKYIEEPIRHGLLGRLWGKISIRPRFKFRATFLVITSSFILFCIACNSNIDTQPSVQPTIETTITNKAEHPIDMVSPTEESPSIAIEETDKPSDLPMTPEPKEPTDKPHTKKNGVGKGVFAIGDSVILDAAPFLVKMLPGIVVDGKVGRQMSQAKEVIDRRKSTGELGNQVIIELGTNGAFSAKQLRTLLSSLDDIQHIILVNTRVPRKWQNTVNSTLRKVAFDFPNVTVVDWHSSSKGKPAYFSEDGVHLTREGAAFYASLIANAIQTKKP